MSVGYKIYPASIGGFFASDARVRLTAWGETPDAAIAELVRARREHPKGITIHVPDPTRKAGRRAEPWTHSKRAVRANALR